MIQEVPAPASPDQWTLIRGARQLLTLRGSSGPRRGTALSELNAIHDGALLLRNGLVEECGPSRRVENLASARKAREIDVRGKIVMPAFVDPDGVLVDPPGTGRAATLSRRLLESGATSLAADWTRNGVLSLGAHTGFASCIKDAVKILRVHRSLQGKPLRIRSVVAACFDREGSNASEFLRTLDEKWFPTIRARKLASVVEFTAGEEGGLTSEQIRLASVIAANHGFSIRLRCSAPLDEDLCALSIQAGTVGLIGFPPENGPRDVGGVYVLPSADALSGDSTRSAGVRRAIDNGIPIAVASAYRTSGLRCANPQYLLHVAIARFGLTCEEAIVALCYNAACALKMSHVTGSLEHGKSADLVVMDVPDYRDLANRPGHSDVIMTVRGGQPVYRRGAVTAAKSDLP